MKHAKRFLSLVAALAMLSATAVGITGCGLSGLRSDSDDRYDDDNILGGIINSDGSNRPNVSNGVVVSKVETVDGELIITYTDGSQVNLGPVAGIDQEQDLEFYPLSDGTYGVKMGNALYKDEITIPDTYRGSSVTQILPGGFSGAVNLRTVNIPESIHTIGANAFSSCSSLNYITISKNVTSIGSNAFADCHNLYDVYVYNVEAWMNIWFEDESSCPGRYATIHFLDSYGEEIRDLSIPDGTSTIPRYAFMGCRNLNSISIPGSVNYISAGAFKYCSSLTSISLTDALTEIGEYAFADCHNLTSFTIPDSVEYVGRGILSGCSSLVSIELPFLGYARGWSEYAYLGYVFGAPDYSENYTYVPYSLTSVTINGGDYLGSGAFAGCSNLISITLPGSLYSIGYEAFRSCSSLSSIYIPENVSDIGDYAFADCGNLNDVVVPNSVNTIGYSAFAGCHSLKSITLPFVGGSRDGYNSTAFGYIFGASYASDNSYYVPSSLTDVVITDTNHIGSEAFRDCSNLITVILPENLTTISNSLFYGCYSLNQVQIPSGVDYIDSYAFYNCTNLNYAILPYSVTSIGDYAFAYCTYMKTIYYEGSEYDWENNVYKGYDWSYDSSFGMSYNFTP